MPKALKTDSQQCLVAPALTASQIKKYRTELGMTQEEFAKEFDIPLGTLRDWEQGLRASRGTYFLLRFLDELFKKKQGKFVVHT